MQEVVRDKLKFIKENIGITYQFMATKSGVSYDTVRNLIKGRNISEENLIKLFDYANDIERRFKD